MSTRIPDMIESNESIEYVSGMNYCQNFFNLSDAIKSTVEVCPVCGKNNYSIESGKRKCRSCNHEWNKK